MRRILLLCSIILLFGCHASSPQVVKVSDTAYQIPVSSDFAPDFTPAGIPFDPETVLVTIPASSLVTHVVIHPKKKTLAQKMGLSNEPRHDVVSDNPSTIAEQPKQTTWWKWALVIIFLFALFAMVVLFVMNRLTFPFWRR